MKTAEDKEFPEIEWDKGELNDSVDAYDKFYGATGYSQDGRKWSGDWYECGGEFVEIQNIQEEI